MRTKSPKLSSQIKNHVLHKNKDVENQDYVGNTETLVSTGSTLLDLAISGGRKRGGGIPGGVQSGGQLESLGVSSRPDGLAETSPD